MAKQVRIDDELYDLLLKAAKADRRSIKVYLALVLEEHFKKFTKR